MNRALQFTASIMVIVILVNCKNPQQPQYYKLVEGVWNGTLAGSAMVITFIEGEFENYPTLSGSAYLTSDNQATAYQIFNGTHNRSDSLWFSLYKIPVVDKGEYQLRAGLKANCLEGLYMQFNSRGEIIRRGNWQVKKTP